MATLPDLSSHSAMPAGRLEGADAVAELLLEQGPAPGPTDLASPLLMPERPAQSPDSRAWFAQAERLQQGGHHVDALAACRQAIEGWPDIWPVASLALDLAERIGDGNQAIEMARLMVRTRPDDLVVANRLAGMLCARGDLAEALPLLRVTAPVLRHRDSALWNYTATLATTGAYRELLTLEPLLDELAATEPPPYGPFAHLAVAKMAGMAERRNIVRDGWELRRSPAWLDAAGLVDRLGQVIRDRQPFAFVSFSPAEARFLITLETRNHLVLRPQELSAVVNSVWRSWFGRTIETEDPLRIGALGQEIREVIATADVIGLPAAAAVEASQEHFGFVAEMQRMLLVRYERQDGCRFTDDVVNQALHEMMPFMRPLLAGLPFIGFVGRHPALIQKLRHFCGIAQLGVYIVPADVDQLGLPEAMRTSPQFPQSYEHTMASLQVPYEGAVFLIAAGFLGKAYANRIRSLGGIAIEIGDLADRWAGF